MAGDGKGGTKLSFTMTLFPPIGSTTADFGYTADITDGVVPRATVSALPVNPLESPTFKSGGAPATRAVPTPAPSWPTAPPQIDTNLLKLRDGAGDAARRPDQAARRRGPAQRRARRRRAPGRAPSSPTAPATCSDGLGKIDKGASTLAVGSGRRLDGGTGWRGRLGRPRHRHRRPWRRLAPASAKRPAALPGLRQPPAGRAPTAAGSKTSPRAGQISGARPATTLNGGVQRRRRQRCSVDGVDNARGAVSGSPFLRRTTRTARSTAAACRGCAAQGGLERSSPHRRRTPGPA